MFRYCALFISLYFAFVSSLKSQIPVSSVTRAETMNSRGNEFLSKGMFQEASLYFDSAIVFDNKHGEYFRNRGLSEESIDNTTAALRDYLASISLQPSNPLGYFFAGKIYLKINSYDSAIYFFTKAIKLSTDKKDKALVPIYYNRGNTYLKLKQFESAVKEYNSAISLDKTHYPSFLNRGIAYYSLQRRDAACNDWYVASSNGNKLADDYFSKYCLNYTVPEILLIKQQTGNSDNEASSANSELSSTSEDRIVYRNGLDLMPEFKGGKEAFHNYLQKKTKFPLLAREYGVQGTVYTTFIVEADGTISHARILKGVAKVLDEECLKVVNSMPRWTPGMKDGKPVAVQFNLPLKFTLTDVTVKEKDRNFDNGMKAMHDKDFMNAIADFSKSIDHNGYSSVEAYEYRGICHYQLGDYEKATQDILFARDLIASDADSIVVSTLTPIAIYYLEKEDYKNAVSLFTEVITVKSGNGEAYWGRGNAYFSLGEKSKACEDFKRAKFCGKKEASEMITKCCSP